MLPAEIDTFPIGRIVAGASPEIVITVPDTKSTFELRVIIKLLTVAANGEVWAMSLISNDGTTTFMGTAPASTPSRTPAGDSIGTAAISNREPLAPTFTSGASCSTDGFLTSNITVNSVPDTKIAVSLESQRWIVSFGEIPLSTQDPWSATPSESQKMPSVSLVPLNTTTAIEVPSALSTPSITSAPPRPEIVKTDITSCEISTLTEKFSVRVFCAVAIGVDCAMSCCVNSGTTNSNGSRPCSTPNSASPVLSTSVLLNTRVPDASTVMAGDDSYREGLVTSK